MKRVSEALLRVPARALSRRVQLLILLAAAVLIAVAIGVKSVAGYLLRGSAQSAAKQETPSGSFRPTREQMTSLKIAPVSAVVFRSEQLTDGKIAINNERATPVFSPYSGRVTKVIVNLGEDVNRGTPLLAVEASEFVQAQNDLLSALAALNTARSQLNLAQTNEKRKQALYEAQAGALQDWQQSQAELVNAQNNVRAAETALASVRNRLRILGKTETQIRALENAQKQDPVAFVLAPISG